MRVRTIVLCCFSLVGGCGGSPPPTASDDPDDVTPQDDAGSTVDPVTPADAGTPPIDPPVDPDAGIPPVDPPVEFDIDELAATLADTATSWEEADALLNEVSREAGWPVREGGRTLFVTRWSTGTGPRSLVGDFNEWNTSEHPIFVSPTGVHGYVVVESGDFQGDAVGSKYKWFWGEGDYRAPSESRSYTYDEFGEIGYVRPPTETYYFQRFHSFESEYLDSGRTVRVYVPAIWESRETAGHLRTLLLHDGQNVFGTDGPWGGVQVDSLLRELGYDDVFAIGVDNTFDRMDVYTQVPDRISGSTVGGKAAEYSRFLRDEVLPFLRAEYGVTAQGESLMVSGSSLGGLVSLYMALEDSDLVGCVGAFSSTLGWGAFASNEASGALVNQWREAGHQSTAIYLDSGGNVEGSCVDRDGDGVVEDSNHSDNYCTTLQLRDVLATLGYEMNVDLFHYWEPNAQHNEAAWHARFPRALAACEAAGWE